MEVQLKSRTGEDVGTIEVSDFIWAEKMNGPVLHQAVVGQLANMRQGNHQTKSRAFVIGSGRKLRAQKGSGRARVGDRKSPTMRGGGVAHGPLPRSYRQRTPVKVRRLALRVALADQLRRGKVTFINEFGVTEPKTASVVEIIKSFGAHAGALLVTAEKDSALLASSANLTKIEVQMANLLSPVEVTRARQLIISQDAARRIDELWGDRQTAPVRKLALA